MLPPVFNRSTFICKNYKFILIRIGVGECKNVEITNVLIWNNQMKFKNFLTPYK